MEYNIDGLAQAHYKVWDEITYQFPNFNTIEVWEWMSNFIQWHDFILFREESF